jgi:methylase of polypeptide subunit release factors
MSPTNQQADEALLRLLQVLDRDGYDFVTPTPSTQGRVIGRPGKERARNLRDVLGWSLPFEADAIPAEVLEILEQAHAITHRDGVLKSRLRVSRVEGRLFLHSAYPTHAQDAVFLGPDTYRFASLLKQEITDRPKGARIVDIGAGAGVGGITAADQCDDPELTLTDINPKALRLAKINAEHAGRPVREIETSGLDACDGPFDIVVANPPYILGGQTYKDGGDMHGARMSLDWSIAAMKRLAPGGRLILYTGSAIVDGRDEFRDALAGAVKKAHCDLRYREIDPDVFGGTLNQAGYEDVERIAAVAAVATRPA